MFETATAFLMRDVSKTKFSLAEVTVYLCWFRVLQDHKSLDPSQYGGVSAAKIPMMHSDVQDL